MTKFSGEAQEGFAWRGYGMRGGVYRKINKVLKIKLKKTELSQVHNKQIFLFIIISGRRSDACLR